MTFTPKTWHDGPSGATPITAAELTRIEAGIVEALAAAAEGGGGGSVLADLPPTGTLWGVPGVRLGRSTSWSVFANAVYYSLISTATPIVITAAKLIPEVAGANVRMGIYASDLSMQPDDAPLWDSGSINAADTITVTDLSVSLEPGYYLAAFTSDADLSVTSFEHSGTRFAEGDIVGSMFSLQDFGPFPTPGTHWLAHESELPKSLFTLQWTNA